MSVGQFFVNLFNHVDCEDLTVRLAGKLVSTVRRTDGNGQSVQFGFGNESGCLVRVGNQTFFINHAFSSVTVFLVAFAGFKRTDNAEFAFNRGTNGMCTRNDFFGYVNVVFERRRRFAVSFQRTVHHYGRIAVYNRGLANVYRRTVILMQTNRQFGEHFDTGGNHMTNHRITGKFAGTGRSLQDNRSVYFLGSLQNGDNLFHIVNIESGNTVVVLGGMVKNLTHSN